MTINFELTKNGVDMFKMKYLGFYIILFLLISGITWNSSARDFHSFLYQDGDGYLAFAEKMPTIQGGLEALYKGLVYPPEAVTKGVQGKVFVMAFVDENGKVTDVKVLRGIGSGCDEAAVQAVKACTFDPGQHEGKNVKVKMSLAIQFKL